MQPTQSDHRKQLWLVLSSHSKDWKPQYLGKSVTSPLEAPNKYWVPYDIQHKEGTEHPKKFTTICNVSISMGYQHILIHSFAFLESEKTVTQLLIPLGTSSSQTALALKVRHKHILRIFSLQSQCGVNKTSIWRNSYTKGRPFLTSLPTCTNHWGQYYQREI